MIKSWLVSVVVLLLLGIAVYSGIFDWLASGNAMIVGAIAVAVTLTAAFFVLMRSVSK